MKEDDTLSAEQLPVLVGDKLRFPCPKCGKTYQWKYSRDNHLRNECGVEPSYKCPYCQYKAKRRFHIKQHCALKHALIPP
ncbi:longitudinals lacking protein, isoforms A/B/D/L-like [Nilaparvata lugens]|uniref:longitudinals lacking protein, isoforms A/B/D/L-like n=1 Tax=Nilaparvata lugens TaxID=108931 RepID=UPI00193E71E5|nr:longitudinals lacking protein, isoforms A/B/D/L-like [Nilaparvata lugens]